MLKQSKGLPFSLKAYFTCLKMMELTLCSICLLDNIICKKLPCSRTPKALPSIGGFCVKIEYLPDKVIQNFLTRGRTRGNDNFSLRNY